MKIKSYLLHTCTLLLVAVFAFTMVSCGDDDPAPVPSSAKDILTFSFTTPPATGVIAGTNITLAVPFGTNVTALTPTITVSELATVSPASGVAQNFTNPVTYTVTAEDGTTQAYTVSVNVGQNTQNDITTFSFVGFDPVVTGTIAGTTITVNFPYPIDPAGLVPTIEVSAEATVSPASGVAQNFAGPIQYTVTAQNGTTKVYTVNVGPKLKLTAIWQRNQAAGNVPSWMTANGERELSAAGDYVYVGRNNDQIRVLDRLTGTDVKVVREVEGVPTEFDFIDAKELGRGGVLNFTGMDADTEGNIIGSNLRLGNNEANWNVYRWTGKDAAQEEIMAYAPPTGYRLGDNMTVAGSTEGTGAIFAPAAGTNKILKFDISGGVTSTSPTEIALTDLPGNLVGNSPSVAMMSNDPGANFILFGTSLSNIAEYSQAGGARVSSLPVALAAEDKTKTLFNHMLDGKVFTLGERKFLAGASTDNANRNRGYLYVIDITDGLANVNAARVIRVPMSDAQNLEQNANGTGGVHVIVSGNTAKVYGLVTNMGVAAFDFTID
jgi:hypothetical protein